MVKVINFHSPYNTDNKILFDDLKIGDYFMIGDYIYIKCGCGDKGAALSLRDGTYTFEKLKGVFVPQVDVTINCFDARRSAHE